MTNLVRFDWKAWVSWVALTMVGIELAVITFSVVLNNYPNSWKVGLVTLGVAATLYATMQWIWLRRRISHALWWIPATVLGWYLAVAVFNLLDVAADKADLGTAHNRLMWLFAIIAYCLSITALGLPQWFVLRRRFRRSFYWIAARPLAWLVGLGFAFLGGRFSVFEVGFILSENRVFGRYVDAILVWIAAGALFGFGFAAITGATMVWMQTTQKDPSGPSS